MQIATKKDLIKCPGSLYLKSQASKLLKLAEMLPECDN